MKGSCAEVHRRLSCAILRYLLDHPGAKTTADGVARWWLSEERGASPLGDAERALALLVSKGTLVETRRAGVPPYYRLAPAPDTAATAPRSGKPLLKNKRDRRNFVNGIRSRKEIQEWTSYFVTAPKRRAVRAGGANRKKGHVRCDPTVPIQT